MKTEQEYHRMNFDELINMFVCMSGKAQATFMYKLIMCLGPAVCRTIIKYCHERLDRINAALPIDDPNYQQFKVRLDEGRSLLTKEEANDIRYTLSSDDKL